MKILFSPDISFKNVQDCSKETAYNCMKNTASVFRQADFSMLNLENIFGDPDVFKPIKKSGPNLISSPDCINYINALRPDIVGMANNHAGDFGDEALFFTMNLLKDSGYQVIGVGKNIDEAYKGAILEKDGISAYIIAVCENEFGIAEKNKSGAAGYSLGRLTKAIFDAKAEGMHPIVYFHGGNEHYPFPAPSKKELYRHFIDIGASAVIAMHTHCPQGYEYYNGAPIVYSMGNFFFPYSSLKHKAWYNGYMTMLDITENEIKLDIIPYKFDQADHTPLEIEEKEKFIKYIEYISTPIANDALLSEYFDSWCLISSLENGYINAMSFSKEMLSYDPSFDIAGTKNIITCEAHAELMRNTFKIIFEQRIDSAKSKIEEIKILQTMELPS